MALNFGSLATTQASSSSNYLRPWNIYSDVKFVGVEGPVTGNTQNGGTWKAWDFKFSCPEGNYSERIFEPTEKSAERRKVQNANGHETELPSDFDRTMAFIAQVGNTFNPTGYKKLQEVSSKIQNFDQMIACIQKYIGTPDTTTNLKLAGKTNQSGTTYASLPTFVRINGKTGEVFTSDNFVGEKVAFSTWEKGKKEEYESAKPTTPVKKETKQDDLDLGTTPTKGSEDDIDFDALGL